MDVMFNKIKELYIVGAMVLFCVAYASMLYILIAGCFHYLGFTYPMMLVEYIGENGFAVDFAVFSGLYVLVPCFCYVVGTLAMIIFNMVKRIFITGVD